MKLAIVARQYEYASIRGNVFENLQQMIDIP